MSEKETLLKEFKAEYVTYDANRNQFQKGKLFNIIDRIIDVKKFDDKLTDDQNKDNQTANAKNLIHFNLELGDGYDKIIKDYSLLIQFPVELARYKATRDRSQKNELFNMIDQIIDVKKFDPNLTDDENRDNQIQDNLNLIRLISADDYQDIRKDYSLNLDDENYRSKQNVAIKGTKEFNARLLVLLNEKKHTKTEYTGLFAMIDKVIDAKKFDSTLSNLDNNKNLLETIDKLKLADEFKDPEYEDIRRQYISHLIEKMDQSLGKSEVSKSSLENEIINTLEQGFAGKKSHKKIVEDVLDVIKTQEQLIEGISDKKLHDSSKFLVEKSAKMYETGSFSKIGNATSVWFNKAFNSKERAETKKSFIEVAKRIFTEAGIKKATDKNPAKDKFANQVVKNLLDRNKTTSYTR